MTFNEPLPDKYKNGREDARFEPSQDIVVPVPSGHIEIALGDEIVLRDPPNG